MDDRETWPRQFEAAARPPAGGGLPDARLAERGRRRRAGGVAAPQPLRHERGREPRRLAHDGRRARVASTCCARATARREEPLELARARADREPRGRDRPRARGAARRLRRARAARRARELHARPSGSRSSCTTCSRVPFEEIAPIVGRSPAAARQLASRARRRVRGAPAARRGPRPAAARSSTRSWPPRARATSTRSSRSSTRTSCCASTAARRRRARRPRSAARRPCAGQALTFARAGAASPGPRSSTAPPAFVVVARRAPARGRGRSPSRDGRIVEIDLLADPARLRAARRRDGSTAERPPRYANAPAWRRAHCSKPAAARAP